jgi:HJR/Mrr/RecB family endonuclease
MGSGVRRLSRALDRAVDGFVEVLTPRIDERWGCLIPGYVSGAVVLILPFALRWVPLWYEIVDFLVLAAAVILSVAYLATLSGAGRTKNLLEWTADLRRLDADEFEWLVFELFQREGYRVLRVRSQHHGDGNIDLLLTRDAALIIVQCKRWTAWFIGPEDIQRLAGTFPPPGDVTGRWFVTLSNFTEGARSAAECAGIVLVDGSDLAERLQHARRSEACPRCDTPMLLDRSAHGWWLRCPRFGACDGERDLSRDPGRAVDLLLEQPESFPSRNAGVSDAR